MSEAIDRIQAAISGNKICIFMKGNRNFPQCGFSACDECRSSKRSAPLRHS